MSGYVPGEFGDVRYVPGEVVFWGMFGHVRVGWSLSDVRVYVCGCGSPHRFNDHNAQRNRLRITYTFACQYQVCKRRVCARYVPGEGGQD